MSALSSFVFAQVVNATNAAPVNPVDAAAQAAPWWTNLPIMILIFGVGYFVIFRPQAQAAKKAKETIGGAKTGDKVIMTNGIHGVISNIKDSTFVVKIADNVKIEVEKSVIDKVTRESAVPAKA